MHAQLIDLCGGINVAKGPQKGEMGLTPVKHGTSHGMEP